MTREGSALLPIRNHQQERVWWHILQIDRTYDHANCNFVLEAKEVAASVLALSLVLVLALALYNQGQCLDVAA